MKNNFVVIIVFIFGCSIVPEYTTDWETLCLENDLRTIGRIFEWVYLHITYVRDSEMWGEDDLWQTPELTVELRTGDCEDLAILMARMIYDNFGEKPEIIGLVYHSEEKDYYHGVVKYDGRFYDPTIWQSYKYDNIPYPWEYYITMSYDQAIKRAEKDSKEK